MNSDFKIVPMGTQRYSTLGWLPPRASGIYKLNPHGSKFPELASLITCNNLVSDKKFPVYGNKQNPSNHKRQIVATQNYPSDVNKSKLTDEGKPVTVNGHSEKKFESKSNVEKTSEEKNQDCKSEEMSCSSRKRRRKRQKNKKRDKNHKEQEKTKEPHDKPKKKDCKPWHKGTLKMEISLDLNMPCDSVPETPVPQQCPVGTHNYTIDIFSLISKNTPHNHQRHPKHKPLTPNIFPPVTQSNDVSGSCNNVQNNNWFRYRCRVPSVCESEDSFIVFDDTSDCESNGSEDLSDSEEISDSTVDIATKKVCVATYLL